MSDRNLLLDARALAHELRTPLAAAQHAASLLDDGDEVAVVRNALAHMAALLAEPSMRPGAAGPVDVTALLADVFERVAPSAAARQVTVTAGDGPRPDVVADRVRVLQVLTNLVANAAAHASSMVRVDITAVGSTVTFTVLDDGPGLDEDQCETVFEPFTRLRANTPGQGMGLALCRLLARACGGEVCAAPGPGGRFTLLLPAA